jgi:hypothetical protein
MDISDDIPADVTATDAALRAVLAGDRPPVGLEDGIIARLRSTGSTRAPWSPPARRAAVAVAAAVVVIGAGRFGSEFLAGGDREIRNRAKEASQLHQIGLAIMAKPIDTFQSNAAGVGFSNWDSGRRSDPFAGTRRNNIFGYSPSAGTLMGATSPGDSADSVMMPATDDAEPAKPAALPPPPVYVPSVDAAQLSDRSRRLDVAVKQLTGGKEGQLGLDHDFFKVNDGIPAINRASEKTSDEKKREAGANVQGQSGRRLAAADDKAVAHKDTLNDAGGDLAEETNAGSATLRQESNRTEQFEREKQRTIDSLADSARQYQKQGDTAKAEAAIAQIKRIDPSFSFEGTASGASSGASAPATTQPAVDGRKVIRTGTMAFDVDRFDVAADTLTKVVGEAGGFVATVDSQKLPNGKTQGMVTVRCPPERLDVIVLSLRSLGDLKSQQIVAQDVTKEYTDLEGELTADRAMQDRLLDLIRTGKGSIKDLLAAENELGTWRTKIEKIEGELRYMNGQIGLSTLAVTLAERDLRQAAATVETETADMGVEADDVEKARDGAFKAIDDAKGRIVEAELKRLDAGQLAARIVADVPPEMAGATIDRLKQLGRVARLEVHRQQVAADAGDTTSTAPTRTDRKPTRIVLSIYNLANVAPRRTTALTLAASDPESAYAALLALANPGGRVVTSNLDRSASATGTVSLEVPPARLEAALAAIRSSGEVLKRTTTENADTQNTTDAKVGLTVSLVALSAVAPRETVVQTVAAADVPTAYRTITAAAGVARAHVRTAELNEQDRRNVTATVEVDVPRDGLADFNQSLAAAGDTIARSSARSADAENTADAAVRVKLSLVSADGLSPRETTTLAIEVTDADKAAADAQAVAVAAGGRVLSADVNRSPSGPATAKVTLDVPLARAADVVRDLRGLGTVRGVDAGRDPNAPAGPLAHAHVEVTLATADALVADASGPWANVRHGLSVGLTGLLWSLQLIVVGLCLLVPWAVVGYVVRRVWMRVSSHGLTPRG